MNYVEIFSKEYDIENYNCSHFACEVYKILTGLDISDSLNTFYGKDRKAVVSKLRKFKKLDKPEENCIVLFHGFKNTPHVGIFHKSKLLHITETGVKWQELEEAFTGFETKGFYIYE